MNTARVAIVGGKRSPFAKAGGALSEVSAKTLLAETVKAAVGSVGGKTFVPEEAFLGTVLLDPRFPNLARDAMFEAGMDPSIPAQFVSNNCITGFLAASVAGEAISLGRINSAVAGGVESMSNFTLTYQKKAEEIFKKLHGAKTLGAKLSLITRLRPSLLMPAKPAPRESSTGLTMGQHCEQMVQQFAIARSEQDEWALRSHQCAAKAEAAKDFEFERFTIGQLSKDNLVRGDTSIEKLAKLQPAFAKSPIGTLTAGNSTAFTDGASVVCLMSESAAKAGGYEILGFLDSIVFSALDPKDGLLMAPTFAIPAVLKKLHLNIADIDLFEIHEAFAGQVLCNLKGLEKGFLHQQPFGTIPREKINLHGGSLALGHPFAATGGRLILSAIHQLKKYGKKRALLSACAAGGMAAACIVSSAE